MLANGGSFAIFLLAEMAMVRSAHGEESTVWVCKQRSLLYAAETVYLRVELIIQTNEDQWESERGS